MKSKTRKKTQSETPKPKEIEKIVKPNARFHTNTVIYNDYIFMFGGTKSLLPSEQLNDFWRYSLKDGFWEKLKESYLKKVGHTKSVLYQNKMIYYGGYKNPRELVTIDLDTLKYTTEDLGIQSSFYHGIDLWIDELILVPNPFLETLIMINLQSKETKKFELPYKIRTHCNPSSFIKDDILYFTMNEYICKFDLINKKFSKIEKVFPFICGDSTMKYYQGSIYFFGGDLKDKASNQFYKINFTSFEYEDIKHLINIEPRYGHFGVIYKDELIIYGGYNGIKTFDDIIRFNLSDKFLSNFQNILKKGQKDTVFSFQ